MSARNRDRVPVIVSNDGTATCSLHGETVVLTTGTWSGRAMLECIDCGAYMIVEGTEHD